MDPPPPERRPSAFTQYITQGSAATAAPPSSPSASKAWFRRGSASANDASNVRSPPRQSQPQSGDELYSPTRQVFPSSTSSAEQPHESNGPTNLSRESHSPPTSQQDMPTTSYPKPSATVPQTDLPPPIRGGRPFMDHDAAAAERARRAEEHRIKMRERKEAQAIEALMFKQEQRMSRRSANQPKNFVPKGNDIPPVPSLPSPAARDSLLAPTQDEIDEQGRRTTLERNIDTLISDVEGGETTDGSVSGSISNGQNGRLSTVSQPPSFPILDSLAQQQGQLARARSYGSAQGQEHEGLAAAISLQPPALEKSTYSPSEGGEPSPLDSAFDLAPFTPTSATGRPSVTYLSPAAAVPRPLRRESSTSSTYFRRSINGSDTELLPDDGKSRDATELFKFPEQLAPTKRQSAISRAPSSNRNTRTVSILKYSDNPQGPEAELPPKEQSLHNVTFRGENVDHEEPLESIYDMDREFMAFEDLTLVRRLAHLCMIFPYSILGMLVRFGLNNLFSFDGSSISSLLWAQGISAAIFGLVLGKREDLTSLYPPIWTGLSVGFAGSINSFSGWMLQTFIAFSNFNDYSRGGFQDFLDGFSQLAVTLLVAHGAMSFGIHCARYLPSLPDAWRTSPSRFSPTPRADVLAIVLSVVAYVIAIISYAFFGTSYWRHQLVFPMILAPAGAVVRYYLSRMNATIEPLGGANGLPTGTLIANLLGTAILAASYILMRVDLKSTLSVGQCAALNSLSIGFAGTLTNLAAMVFEARAVWLTNRWRWAYVVGSILSGQLLMVAIFGGIWWGGGSVSDVCSLR